LDLPIAAGVRPDGKVEGARAVSVRGQEARATFERARPARGRAKRSVGAGGPNACVRPNV
jgi:hypothetical protein